MSEETQAVNEGQSAEAPVTQNTETSQEVSAPEEKPLAPDYSKQFAELRQREKAIRLKELEATRKAEAKIEEFRKSIQADPLAALQAQGINPQDLASSLLNASPQEEPNELEQLRYQFEELQKWQQDKIKAEQQAQHDQAISEYKAQVFKDLESDESSTFEILLNHPRGKQYFWDAILQYSERFKEAPSLEERKEMASKLEEQLFNEVSTLTKLSKFGSLKQPEEAPKQAPSEPKPKGKVTLNSSMSPRYKMSTKEASKKTFSSNDHFDQVFNKFFSK